MCYNVKIGSNCRTVNRPAYTLPRGVSHATHGVSTLQARRRACHLACSARAAQHPPGLSERPSGRLASLGGKRVLLLQSGVRYWGSRPCRTYHQSSGASPFFLFSLSYKSYCYVISLTLYPADHLVSVSHTRYSVGTPSSFNALVLFTVFTSDVPSV